MFGEVSTWKEEQLFGWDQRILNFVKFFWNSKISVLEPSICFVTRLFLCILHWLEGMIWLCGQKKGWVELLNHQFLSYWPQPHVIVVIFQFSKTVYLQTPHQCLSVLIFYFKICSQKRYPGSPLTISIETQTLMWTEWLVFLEFQLWVSANWWEVFFWWTVKFSGSAYP